MAKAIVAREYGDEYQRLLLWYYITKLLSGNSDIQQLFTEFDEIQGFDDIVIVYARPIFQHGIRSIHKEYLQVKFHQAQNKRITVDSLMDPKFIGSTKYSFLHRLREAYIKCGEEYHNCAFTLYSTYEIDQADVLYSCFSNRDGFFLADKMFDNTVRTGRAKAKNLMMKHLEVDENDLKKILGQLRICIGPKYHDLVGWVNTGLRAVSLKTISPSSVVNPYISLAKKWLEGGVFEITPKFVMDECTYEDLIVRDEQEVCKIAIKSFVKRTAHLSNLEIKLLDLSTQFENGKFINQVSSWENIKNEIDIFRDQLDIAKTYEIYLECSYSLAFAAGRSFNSTSGFNIYPVQKTEQGIKLWHCDNNTCETIEDVITTKVSKLNSQALGTILIISVTHDIEQEVIEFIKGENIQYSKVLHIKNKKVGRNALSDGNQCSQVAEYISLQLYKMSREEKQALTHVFISGPVSLSFYLGKYSSNFGNLQLYEHDRMLQYDQVYLKSATFVGGE